MHQRMYQAQVAKAFLTFLETMPSRTVRTMEKNVQTWDKTYIPEQEKPVEEPGHRIVRISSSSYVWR